MLETAPAARNRSGFANLSFAEFSFDSLALFSMGNNVYGSLFCKLISACRP